LEFESSMHWELALCLNRPYCEGRRLLLPILCTEFTSSRELGLGGFVLNEGAIKSGYSRTNLI
jgi:hypothetical protein